MGCLAGIRVYSRKEVVHLPAVYSRKGKDPVYRKGVAWLGSGVYSRKAVA